MKEVLISQNGDEFIFRAADGTAKLSGKDYESREPTENFKVNWESLNRQNQQMTLKPVPTLGRSIQGDFIYRHHNEPRVQLYVPKELTFPIPLKYIDVTRSIYTDLDVMQEKRVDDHWNVD